MKRCIARNTALTALLLNALPCSAITCEELRAEVETKIRGAGVSRFAVTVVDISAPTSGKVVGSCDRGSKKLVYQQAEALPASPGTARMPTAPAPARPSRQEDPIPTECKDGSISMTGSCKKP